MKGTSKRGRKYKFTTTLVVLFQHFKP